MLLHAVFEKKMACSHGSRSRVRLGFFFVPSVAGGEPGQFAAELYPLRLDIYGSRELSCIDGAQHVILTKTQTDKKIVIDLVVHKSVETRSLVLPFCDALVQGTKTNDKTALAERSGFVINDSLCAASTSIFINLYATTYTEDGQRCWTSLGAAMLPLCTLINLERSPDVHPKFQVVLNRETDPNAKPNKVVIKGVVTVDTVTLDSITLRTACDFDIYQSLRKIETAIAKMNALITRNMEAFFGPKAFLKPTMPFLSPFHVPTDQTDFVLLPSAAYTMQRPTGALDVAYYEQLLRIALRRSHMSAEEALQFAEHTQNNTGRQFERAAFGIMVARMMCIFAVSQCYMDDVLNRNVIGQQFRADLVMSDEDFKICRLCGADDCEGCALEPHMHVNQLCECSDPVLLNQFSPLLRMVRRFLRTFVPQLVLGCVTNKKGTTAQLTRDTALAHTFAVLIPFRVFSRMLPPADRAKIEKSRFYADRAADIREWRGIELYPLLCEGTTANSPAMRCVDAYYTSSDSVALEQAIAAIEAFRSFFSFAVETMEQEKARNAAIEINKSPLRSAQVREERSPFYKFIVSSTTNAFADQFICDFVFVYNLASDTQRTFGVQFADFVDNSDRVGAMSFVTYKEEEARIIDAVIADLQPVPNLKTAPRQLPIDEQTLVRVKSLFKQKPAAPVGIGGTALHTRHTFITMRAQDMSDNILRAMELIVRDPRTRSFDFATYTLNAAVDGTDQHNQIIDFYFTF